MNEETNAQRSSTQLYKIKIYVLTVVILVGAVAMYTAARILMSRYETHIQAIDHAGQRLISWVRCWYYSRGLQLMYQGMYDWGYYQQTVSDLWDALQDMKYRHASTLSAMRGTRSVCRGTRSPLPVWFSVLSLPLRRTVLNDVTQYYVFPTVSDAQNHLRNEETISVTTYPSPNTNQVTIEQVNFFTLVYVCCFR